MKNYKEYLEKQPDGTYSLVLRGDLCKGDDIEVPEGMNYAYDAGSFVQFTKQEMGYRDSVLVWQRELRAMVNPMKEYLDANRNYEFVLSTEKDDGFIEIPNGAIRARFYPQDPDGLEFEGDFCQWWHDKDNEWINYENYSNTLKHSRVVWQREQDEPFLTPECTLNDQYAEIEQVRQQTIDATLAERQSQYGCYEDVAHVTQQILSALRIGNYDELPAPMKESLHMIASKMARIVNGDPEYLDNWHDIGGYAKLIEKLIKGD